MGELKSVSIFRDCISQRNSHQQLFVCFKSKITDYYNRFCISIKSEMVVLKDIMGEEGVKIKYYTNESQPLD